MKIKLPNIFTNKIHADHILYTKEMVDRLLEIIIFLHTESLQYRWLPFPEYIPEKSGYYPVIRKDPYTKEYYRDYVPLSSRIIVPQNDVVYFYNLPEIPEKPGAVR